MQPRAMRVDTDDRPPRPPAVLRARRLGVVEYSATLQAMRRFTDRRDSQTVDEVWLLQHHPVFTQGISCRLRPRPGADHIPVVATDRGGQITYHGPGQLVVYLLLDLKRRELGVKRVVHLLEEAIVSLLGDYGIDAHRRERAPGVYVSEAKIAALGLRVRRGASYHGLSVNVDMDLGPFRFIDPCGYGGLEVTQLRDQGVALGVDTVGAQLLSLLAELLGYLDVEFMDD